MFGLPKQVERDLGATFLELGRSLLAVRFQFEQTTYLAIPGLVIKEDSLGQLQLVHVRHMPKLDGLVDPAGRVEMNSTVPSSFFRGWPIAGSSLSM